jgi:hypothetical protein
MSRRTGSSAPGWKYGLPTADVRIYLALAGVGVCTRRRPARPLAVARVMTAAGVAVVGVAAWLLPGVYLAEALPIFAAIVGIHAFVAVRLRAQTRVIDATALQPATS